MIMGLSSVPARGAAGGPGPAHACCFPQGARGLPGYPGAQVSAWGSGGDMGTWPGTAHAVGGR